MKYEDLMLEKKDGIAVITLNAPDKMNALTAKMQKSLTSALDNIDKDDEVKVLILTGAGKAFCSGGDLESLKYRVEGKLKQARYQRLRQVGFFASYFPRLNKPIIGAINGPAAGGGFSLAMLCDIRIASEKAKFGSTFILRGAIPDCALTYFLPRVVGLSKALELMFSGEIFDALEAKRLGIVSQVVRPEDLMKTVNDLATKIANQPPIALELTKKIVYRSILDDVDRHLDWETYGQLMCFQTEDFHESVSAFLEKRPRAPFKGR